MAGNVRKARRKDLKLTNDDKLAPIQVCWRFLTYIGDSKERAPLTVCGSRGLNLFGGGLFGQSVAGVISACAGS